MRMMTVKKAWAIVLICAGIMAILIANVDVLAQPYQRSDVMSPNIQFGFSEFNLTTSTASRKREKDTEIEQYKIHYAYSGNEEKPGVIFVHGTPGGWAAFERYLEDTKLQQDFFLVAVDRMGWGRSDLGKSKLGSNFSLQAKSIAAIMQDYPNKKWTIVGHSLGASIAPKIALVAPRSVDSLLLLAGSLNPKLGRPRWYNWAASTWVVSRLIGKSMRDSNREIMALKSELTQMDAELKQTTLNVDVTVMQGATDKLVSPKNPAYVTNEWQTSFTKIDLIELPKEGHFLPWRQTPLVIQTIYSLRAARNQ